jgi:hypothetical protein
VNVTNIIIGLLLVASVISGRLVAWGTGRVTRAPAGGPGLPSSQSAASAGA